MEVQSDFKDLLALLNVHNVRYIYIGRKQFIFMGKNSSGAEYHKPQKHYLKG